ncbi:Hypoxanthine phosphoribosyltransferase, partial [Linum perenne]
SSRYRSGTESIGAPRVSLDLKFDVKGKHAIDVEDIVDKGNTLASLIREFEWKGASAVSVCAFLDKPARRKVRLWVVESTTEALRFEFPISYHC